MKIPPSRLSAAAGIWALLLQIGMAATRTWQGGSSVWTDADGTRWVEASAPTSNDVINLTQSTAGNITVTFDGNAGGWLGGTATVLNERYANLTLGNAGGGTTTLDVAAGDVLPCGDASTGRARINAGGRLAISGGTFTPRMSLDVYDGTIDQSGGLIQPYYYDLNLYAGIVRISGGVCAPRLFHLTGTTGPATLEISGGELNVPNVNPSLVGGGAYTSTVIQTGGVITNGYTLGLHTNGQYRLINGSFIGRHLHLYGGEFIQTGGLMKPTYDLNMCTYANSEAPSIYRLEGGTFDVRGLFVGDNNGTGTFIQAAGTTAKWGANEVNVGSTNGSGTYVLGDTNGPATCDITGANTSPNLKIGHTGVFRGHGPVPGQVFLTFEMNGRVIADGCGMESDLDFSNGYGGNNSPDAGRRIVNPADNTGSNGWFAVNGGRLKLPTVGGALGSGRTFYVKDSIGSVYNWGESVYADDPQIDLVNSAQFSFTGLGSGNGILTGSLLATNRSDVAAVFPYRGRFLSIHEFSLAANTFSGCSVTVRYDDERILSQGWREDTVRLWHYTGSAWQNVTASVDDANKLVTGLPVTTLGQFAVTADPPPSGTVITVR